MNPKNFSVVWSSGWTQNTFVFVNLRLIATNRKGMPSDAPGSLEVKEEGVIDGFLRRFYTIFKFLREVNRLQAT